MNSLKLPPVTKKTAVLTKHISEQAKKDSAGDGARPAGLDGRVRRRSEAMTRSGDSNHAASAVTQTMTPNTPIKSSGPANRPVRRPVQK